VRPAACKAVAAGGEHSTRGVFRSDKRRGWRADDCPQRRVKSALPSVRRLCLPFLKSLALLGRLPRSQPAGRAQTPVEVTRPYVTGAR
jgi:hypothetical protein